MGQEAQAANQPAIRALRGEWWVYLTLGSFFLALSFLIMYNQWEARYAWRWLLAAVGLAGYVFIFIWRNLDKNRLKDGSSELLPSFGLANGLTIVRSVFNAALAGFLVVPWPSGWLAWAPGTLYLVSCLMDFADGFAARVTGQTTELGEMMDMKWDGTGMVSGVLLSVLYGQTPVVFLLVGLARPLFLIGEWQRRRRNLPLLPLPNNLVSRTLAGVMMGYIVVILLPVYAPPPTHVAAILFMLPFLVNFYRDWLVVSGVIRYRQDMPQPGSTWLRLAYQFFLPLGLRAAQAALLVSILIYQSRQLTPELGIVLVAWLALPAIVFGAAGRVSAAAALLMSGFGFHTAPLEWRYWLLLFVSTALFLTGTGPYSLWKPEEWLMYHRAGERRSAGDLQ